jgi:hypothetical protein
MKRTLVVFSILACFAFESLSGQTPEMIKTVMARTVTIIAMDEDSQPLAFGSGFIVGSSGEIATNYHVIEGAASALVKYPGREAGIPVSTIVHKDPEHDLAVIQVRFKTMPLRLGDDELSQVGDKIMAVGNPEGLTGTVSDGIVSGFRKRKDGARIMQITAPISPGSSGGPVINSRGEVIGIATALLMVGQNLNFAVPVKNLKSLMATKKLQLPFGKRSLPKRQQVAGAQGQKDTSLVRVMGLDASSGISSGLNTYANCSFTVQNKMQRDIRNLKILVLWYEKPFHLLSYKRIYGTMEQIHHNALLIKDQIPANNAKKVYKELSGAMTYWTSGTSTKHLDPGKVPTARYKTYTHVIRILDYEILPTSGTLKFE